MRFKQDKAALGGLAVIDPARPDRDLRRRHREVPRRSRPERALPAGDDATSSAFRTGPTRDFWFGADTAGRDLFVRVLYGARTSLLVALVATGHRGGHRRRGRPHRRLLPRASRTRSSRARSTSCSRCRCSCSRSASSRRAARRRRAASAGSIEPGTRRLVVFVIAIFTWPYIARIVRGNTLSLREKEFVEASRSLGRRQRPHHVPRDPAEPGRADHRLHDAAHPGQHPVRGGALVPRARCAAGHAVVGPDALRRGRASSTSPGG